MPLRGGPSALLVEPSKLGRLHDASQRLGQEFHQVALIVVRRHLRMLLDDELTGQNGSNWVAGERAHETVVGILCHIPQRAHSAQSGSALHAFAPDVGVAQLEEVGGP